MSASSYEETEFTRDCQAVRIPFGDTVLVPAGTGAVITQSLGDTYTLQIPTLGGLYRIADIDADAIGKEPRRVAVSGTDGELNEEMIWGQLKNVYDPEIPVNIVDLGLVYDMRLEPTDGGKKRVFVAMTLTAQGCGMGPSIAMDARMRIESLPGVDEADVQVVWDPPWNPQMISPEGREKLGM
jgi:probable FeS assembly SUF system protein SufT